MTEPLSVLVIIASPDERDSTSTLRLAVEEMQNRSDVRVSVWFLRSWAPEVPWDGARVVDSLRTWAGTNILSAIGLSAPAGWLRGRRLRSWLREVSPDVVVLDDGMGDRVLAPLQHRPVRVVRVNEELPPAAFAEPRLEASRADVAVLPPYFDGDLPSSTSTLEMGGLRDVTPGRRMRDDSTRGALLGSLGVPDGAPVIVGWGDDGWIDGPDLFVRALWTLEARHGLEPIGVWLGLGGDPLSVERLRGEAERCGLSERFVLATDAPLSVRYSGDVTFLPVRTMIDDEDMVQAMAAGSRLVTFQVNAADDLPVVAVADLDLEAAAEQLAVALRAAGRAEPLPIDPAVWVDRFMDLVGSQLRR